MWITPGPTQTIQLNPGVERVVDVTISARIDGGRAMLSRTVRLVPPLMPLVELWHHRRLVVRLARREVEAQFRGSLLGLLWTLLVPLLMLAVYSFVFSVVFEPRWTLPPGGRGNFALLLFSGLIIFSMFAEPVNRAPGLVLENVSYVKRVIFPLVVLPWVSLAVAAFTGLMSGVVLAAYYLLTVGLPPLSVLWLPICFGPLVFLTVGLGWMLSGLGVYLRDLRPLVSVLVSGLFFLSPVFYPLTAIPERYRPILELNPLAVVLEGSKAALFYGLRPNLRLLAISSLACFLFAWAGHATFRRLRPGFADVV